MSKSCMMKLLVRAGIWTWRPSTSFF